MGCSVNTGLLNSFHYACSTPGDLKVPLTPYAQHHGSLHYLCRRAIGFRELLEPLLLHPPAGVLDGDMHRVSSVFQGTFPANDGSTPAPQGQCNNFTFVATRENSGGPVALELDNVVYAVCFSTSNL